MTTKVTYGDYRRTGQQDCDNVFDLDEFERAMKQGGKPEDIVDRVFEDWEYAGLQNDWLDQNEDDVKEEGLDPGRAYSAWKAGWKERAASKVAFYAKRAQNPAATVYYLAKLMNHDDPSSTDEWIAESEPSFDKVLEEAATEIVRKGHYDALDILIGDADGPHETIARIESISVAENEEAFAAKCELVLTIDHPSYVPRAVHDVALEGPNVISLEYGPMRSGQRDQSYVYVQFNPLIDDSVRRFAAMELDPDDVRMNPRGLTKKGERMYQHVLAATKLRATAQVKGAKSAARRTVVGAARRGVPGLVKKNPAEIFAEDADAAVDKYKEFHRYDPKRLEELGSLVIPTRVKKLGGAKYVLYQSGKVDPATLKKPRKPVDYIHEHDAGVMVYVTDGTADTDVPKAFTEVTALVRLGKCLGFALRDGTEAQGSEPLPDLACTPDGKCLLVIQGKTQVLAMFWGGALGVFARGIDG